MRDTGPNNTDKLKAAITESWASLIAASAMISGSFYCKYDQISTRNIHLNSMQKDFKFGGFVTQRISLLKVVNSVEGKNASNFFF